MSLKTFLVYALAITFCIQGFTDTVIPENAAVLAAHKENVQQFQPPPFCKIECNDFPPLLEVKGGYFFFSESKMRKVYNEGGVDLQINGSYPIYRWLHIYAGVEYLERHGRSLHFHQKTSIWQFPISMGLKAFVQVHPKIHYYFTLGPRLFLVYTHHHSSFVSKRMSEDGFGGFLATGFNFYPYRGLLVDIFGEYSYKRMHFDSHKTFNYLRTTQIGGFTFGIGLGYAF
jgi:hypothetical protein